MTKLLTLATSFVLLIAAGQASAVTYTFDADSAGTVCVPGPDPDCSTATGTQIGTGDSLLTGDSSSASLISTLTVDANVLLFGSIPDTSVLGVTVLYTGGTLTGDVFTYTEATQIFTSCEPATTSLTCAQLAPPNDTMDLPGGSITFDLTPGGVTVSGDSTFSNPMLVLPPEPSTAIPVMSAYGLAATIFGLSLIALRRLRSPSRGK